MSKKSVEQKLYEALQTGRGAHLTADDVEDLLGMDDAIRTRVSNEAAREAGVSWWVGGDNIRQGETWEKLKRRIVDDARNGE